MIEKIINNVTDEKVKAAIIKKINNIAYNGTDCSSMAGSLTRATSGKSINGMLVDNAFYDSMKQSFTFCNGWLMKNSSEFAIAEVIGHELAHSIDPCRIDKPAGASPFTYSEKADLG